jgi:hypothetical protein
VCAHGMGLLRCVTQQGRLQEGGCRSSQPVGFMGLHARLLVLQGCMLDIMCSQYTPQLHPCAWLGHW